jgi:hypothetical protein
MTLDVDSDRINLFMNDDRDNIILRNDITTVIWRSLLLRERKQRLASREKMLLISWSMLQ